MSSQCFICSEPYTVLRHSTVCSLCHKTACSSCCRASSNNPSLKICIICARKQKQMDDPNDDRPKWLRETQDARKSQPPSSVSSSQKPPSVSSNVSGASSKKQDPNDDRPKWLKEAQEQRQSMAASNMTHPSAGALPPSGSAGPNQVIESRLAKLKEEMNEIKPAMTENELSDRVAKLRGMDPKAYAASRQPDQSILRPQPHRTEAEEIEELVAQMKERATLDDANGDEDLIAELERRLERLKAETAALGIPNLPLSSASSPGIRPRDSSPVAKNRSKKQRIRSAKEENDSDEEADRITKLLTVQLPDDPAGEVENQEDWFCVICPEDPTLRCIDCDNDMYCDRCFRECHREWAAMDHKTKRLPKICHS